MLPHITENTSHGAVSQTVPRAWPTGATAAITATQTTYDHGPGSTSIADTMRAVYERTHMAPAKGVATTMTTAIPASVQEPYGGRTPRAACQTCRRCSGRYTAVAARLHSPVRRSSAR